MGTSGVNYPPLRTMPVSFQELDPSNRLVEPVDSPAPTGGFDKPVLSLPEGSTNFDLFIGGHEIETIIGCVLPYLRA
jgi:hypothetical protein